MPAYTQQVDGRRISVFDGLLELPQLAELHRVLLQAGYTRSEIARPDTAEYRHWATEIPLARLPAMPGGGSDGARDAFVDVAELPAGTGWVLALATPEGEKGVWPGA